MLADAIGVTDTELALLGWPRCRPGCEEWPAPEDHGRGRFRFTWYCDSCGRGWTPRVSESLHPVDALKLLGDGAC